MLTYAKFSKILNIMLSYLIINSSIFKQKKVLCILLLIVGLTGIISNIYPFVIEIFLFLILFVLTIKIQSSPNSYVFSINVLCPFLIINLLSFVASKLTKYLLSEGINLVISIFLSEFLFCLIICCSSLTIKNILFRLFNSKIKKKLHL